jgi:hypothetical protein
LNDEHYLLIFSSSQFLFDPTAQELWPAMDDIYLLHFHRSQRNEKSTIDSKNKTEPCEQIKTILDIPDDLLCHILELMVRKSRFIDVVFSYPNGKFFQDRTCRNYWMPAPLVSHKFQRVSSMANITQIICQRCNEFCSRTHFISWYNYRYYHSIRDGSDFYWLNGFYNFRRNVELELCRSNIWRLMDLCKDLQACHKTWEYKICFLTNDGLDKCLRIVLNTGCTQYVQMFCTAVSNTCNWKPRNDLLFKPAMFGRVDQMKILLDTNLSSIKTGGEFALRKASRWNRIDAVKFLLENGAVPTTLKVQRSLPLKVPFYPHPLHKKFYNSM